MTPVRYRIGIRKQQVFMTVYDDGTAQVTTDGSEIGQGLHTKVIQYAAYHMSQIVPGSEVPVSDIRCGPNDTTKVAAGSLTGGSTTSEGCCEAVADAIEKLKEELDKFKEKATGSLKEGETLSFKKLCATAVGGGGA